MSLIKRAKKYLILVSVVMTIILIFLCYISSSFSYVVDHKKKTENFMQDNKRYIQQPVEKINITKSKGDNSIQINSSSIVLSMKEYKNLLADIARNRKMLMDSIWSKTIQNAKELNRQQKNLDTDMKLAESIENKGNTWLTITTTNVPDFKEHKGDNIKSLDREHYLHKKIMDKSIPHINNNGDKELYSLPDTSRTDTDIRQEGKQLNKKKDFREIEKQRLQHRLDKEQLGNPNYTMTKYTKFDHERPVTVYRKHNIKSTDTEYVYKGDNLINRSKVSDFQRQGEVLNELKKLALGQNSRFVSVRGGSEVQQSSSSDNELRKDDCESCIHNDFRYIINQKSLCKHKSDIDILFVILTAPDEFIQRSVIRKTWGTECTKTNLACMFILGNVFNKDINDKLVQESKEFHDIVQFDFKEAYANLTYKTLSGLRWASEYCQGARYIMKTDGDMYVNTELIPTMLKAAPDKRFLGGNCWGLSSPHREPQSKWYVSFNSYSKSKFPPMCSGTGYIMSRDVLTGILRVSRNIPFFHLEDVYVALCTQKLSVTPINLQGFSNMRQSFSPCFYRNSVMTSHYVSPDTLKEYWSQSRTCALENQEPDTLYQKIPYPQVS